MTSSQKEIEPNLLTKCIELCKHMMQRSYCVYSDFPVACVLVGDKGEIFTGVNVENSSYGLSICAERTAAVKAVSEGCRKFKLCVVMTKAKTFIQPCGACRQFLSEFADAQLTVITVVEDGTHSSRTLKELLPHSFSRTDLQDTVCNE